MDEETNRILLQAAGTIARVRDFARSSAEISSALEAELVPIKDTSSECLASEDQGQLSALKVKLVIKSIEVACIREANAYKAKCNSTLLELASAKKRKISDQRRRPSKKGA